MLMHVVFAKDKRYDGYIPAAVASSDDALIDASGSVASINRYTNTYTITYVARASVGDTVYIVYRQINDVPEGSIPKMLATGEGGKPTENDIFIYKTEASARKKIKEIEESIDKEAEKPDTAEVVSTVVW